MTFIIRNYSCPVARKTVPLLIFQHLTEKHPESEAIRSYLVCGVI
jgi:hypothetical protein